VEIGLPKCVHFHVIRSIPVIAVCAVRTGCGKSAVTRRVLDIVRQRGLRPVVIRHPMPYGDLAEQRVQRFATYDDLHRHHCTIEEREEYEPHLDQGTVVYAGVDYQAILAAAETEADVIIWDGGNNDLPFIQPDVHICLVDPHRPGHESQYYPGSANLLMADVVVVPKEDTAEPSHIQQVKDTVQRMNPRAMVIDAASPPRVGDPALITGKRVLVVEDGPTLTHGGLAYGAGSIAAHHLGASECVDPRPYAIGSLVDTFSTYPALHDVLPAMGYSDHQVAELEATINAVPCEAVVFGTPIDLRRVLTLHHPAVRVRYHVEDIGQPTLVDALPDPLIKKTF
ncbi:GTPase, partial [Candidatus Entotheonella palauensis]|uniref:GTPase n=1 Tax=Candidatus Entotheonella palauensis TaxID=93172 RepID=UPI001C4E0618